MAIKRTFKTLSSSRQVRLWNEARQAKKDKAAREKIARTLNQEVSNPSGESMGLPPLAPSEPVLLPPNTPMDEKSARRLARRVEHCRLRELARKDEDAKRMPVHPFRLNEQKFYGLGMGGTEIENPVKRPICNEMVAWCNKHRLMLKRLEEWRWLDSKLAGQVNGLPMLRGRAMMANGIFVIAERSDGSVFYGHESAWVEDEDPNKLPSKREVRARENELLAARLMELLAE